VDREFALASTSRSLVSCARAPTSAEPSSGHHPQADAVRGRQQVVLAVAEEGEVAPGQPAEQLAGLGHVRVTLAAQAGRQLQRLGLHPAVILHRDPHVVEHPAQVGGQLIAGHHFLGQAQLDVNPRFGEDLGARGRLVGLTIRATIVSRYTQDGTQRAGDVAAHAQHRMHDQLDVGLVPVQFGGDRIDQVGHVVDDDVHHQARPAHRVQVRVVGLADLDQGPALRPAQAEPGVRFGDRRQS
jgi:hypothetical protein